MWEVATVTVSNNGTQATITPVDTHAFFEGETNECTWACEPSWYGDNSCDCGCRIMDIDCDGVGCAGPGCCVTGCDYCW